MKDKDRTMRSLVRNDKYLWFFRLFQEHEYLYLTNDIDGYCLWTGEPYYDTEAKCWYEAQGLDIPFRDMEKDAVDLLLGNTAPVTNE